MSKAIGIDPGTAFFQTAEYNAANQITYKTIRNAFVELSYSDDIEEILDRNNWQYVKDGNRYYVIGEDCIQVAKLFPNIEIRRPMQDGVLNKDEEKKMIVLSEMIRSCLGDAPDSNSMACTCISSPSVDGSIDSSFHKARLEAMIARLGWNVKTIEEGLAVVLSQRPTVITDKGEEIPYSGIGLSFGGGRTNMVLAYKGLQITGMSCAYGGDKIDKQVSRQTGSPIAQVVSIKEKKLDLSNIDYDNDVEFALSTYYEDMIKYVFGNFSKKLSEVKSELDYPLDIVVAGGTSMPKGFCDKLSKVIKNLNLPFKIKNVIHASNPRNAVVEGLLYQATVSQKKILKGEAVS